MNFLAAAVTVDTFNATALKRVQDGTVRHFRSFQLSDAAEQQDPTCKALFGYGRSLLYLVSESFEHGGFDDDAQTMRSVISLIKTNKLPA